MISILLTLKIQNDTLKCYYQDVEVNPVFTGTKVGSQFEAEKEVVLKAFRFLEKNHNVQIEDISFITADKITIRCDSMNRTIASFEQELKKTLDDWRASIECLEKLVSAYETDPSFNLFEFADRVRVIKIDALVSFNKNMEQVKAFDGRRWCIASTGLHDTHGAKPWIVPAKIKEKDLLAAVLDAMDIPRAEYNHTVVDNKYFLGEAIVSLDQLDGYRVCGKTRITGAQSHYPDVSENSAALAFVSFLQDKLRIDVVDYTYKKMVEKEKKFQMLHELKEGYRKVARSVLVEWQKMLDDFSRTIVYQGEEFHVAPGTPNYHGYINKMKFSREEILEVADSIRNSFKNAAARLRDAMDEKLFA